MTELQQVRDIQAGLVTRRQALALGMSRTELARALRRGELVVVHPGVYVGHNGPLTWLERAWAGVLWAAPAALCLESAQRMFEGRGLYVRDQAVIHLVVGRQRHLQEPPRIRVHRSAHFDARVNAQLGPPRVRYEHTVLDLAATSRDDLDAIGVLSSACGSRRTTARRLLEALEGRPRTHRRRWLEEILRDVAAGTCSVLEHAYLDSVERAHGLPVGLRQAPVKERGGTMWQDVRYAEWGLVVELDGALGHTSSDERDQDHERDLDALVQREQTTVRLGYRQVFVRGCTTAVKVGTLLNGLGWSGEVHTCPKCGS